MSTRPSQRPPGFSPGREYLWSSGWRKVRMPTALWVGGLPWARWAGHDVWRVDTGSSHGDPGCRQASALGLVSEGENSRVTGSSQRGRAGLEFAGCGPRTTGCSQRGSYVRCPPGCRLPPAPSQLRPKVEAPHHSISITRPGRLYGLHAISSSVIVTHRCLSSLRLGGGPVLRLLKGHLCPTLKAGGSVGPR